MNDLFPFDADDELSAELDRITIPGGELPPMCGKLKNAFGIALQIDEEGFVMGGIVLRDPDDIRGHVANAVIVLRPATEYVDEVVLPSFNGKLGGVDTVETEIYTKG